MANHEIELQVAPMSDETMDYLDTLFSVCKRFNTDYYHATQKERPLLKVPLIVPCIWYTPLVEQNRSGPEAGRRNRREHHE